MSLTIILKYIAVVAYCSILFFGGWTLWQLKIRKQKQSAVAIGFLNGGCVAVIVSIVLMVCGVRRELTEGGLILQKLCRLVGLGAFEGIICSSLVFGCIKNPKIRSIAKFLFLLFASILLLDLMASILIEY